MSHGSVRGEFINKSVSQFVLLKYLAGRRFPGLQLRESCGKSHSGSCVSGFLFLFPSFPPAHLCSPAPVDERADGLVRPRPTGVEVGAVPRLYEAHKVGTLALRERRSKTNGILNSIVVIVPS